MYNLCFRKSWVEEKSAWTPRGECRGHSCATRFLHPRVDLTEAVTLPKSYCYKPPYERQTLQMLTHESLIPYYIEEEHTWLKYWGSELLGGRHTKWPWSDKFCLPIQARRVSQTTWQGYSKQDFPLIFEQPNTAVMQKHCIDLETPAKNYQIHWGVAKRIMSVWVAVNAGN